MTSQIIINNCPESRDNLHFIPCEIQHNSQANVDRYFNPTINTNDQGSLLVEETRKAVTEDEERELTATQSFKSFNYWNLDRSPTELDKLPQALKWIDIAKVLHRPVEEEDSQSSLKSEVSI